MRQKLYTKFIKPVSTDSDQAEREVVLNYLLAGTFILSVTSLMVIAIGPLVSHLSSRPNRLLGNLLTLLFVVGLYFLVRYRRHYRLVAMLLTSLIALFGCFIAIRWGMLNPDGVLLLSLAVVMAGILISARYSLYIACGVATLLFYLQYGESTAHLHPDLNWLGSKPVFGDAIFFSAILLIIALVSWLFNRQMEASLLRAWRSEQALQRQKNLLEIKVEKRARQLEEAQLEKMQELYRFAELGQLSTALFHDLANHLSTVNVDIEGLAKGERSDIMRRIQHNVGHINSIVRRVRQQIGGKSSVEVFDIVREIDEVAKILEPTAKQTKISINVVPDKSAESISHKGDVTRFRQVILNLVCNGMEAYFAPTRRSEASDRVVTIEVKRQHSTTFISVTDYGGGIPAANHTKIFEPFYTTKKEGVGIGLFIVRQVVEKDFGGELAMTSSKQQGTTFTVSLSKGHYAKSV